jgi:hypothetical protein
MSRNTGVRGLTDRFCNHIERDKSGKRGLELTGQHARKRRAMSLSMLSAVYNFME